jgi:hypothetical protein
VRTTPQNVASKRPSRAQGRNTPALQGQIADPVVRRAHAAEMLGVGLIVALMVFKPF